MRQILSLGLLLVVSSVSAQSFYAGQQLAHSIIESSQDSGATIAFTKEKGGVKGYYCHCNESDNTQHELDSYGDSSIESVFYAYLDHNIPQMFVLFKSAGRYEIRAYEYQVNYARYQKLENLQPALDSITKGKKTINAALVKKQLAQLQPFDYSITYEKSGISEFDVLDHSKGALIGYFLKDGKLVTSGVPKADIYGYKKTFQEKDGRWLAVTYRQVPGQVNDLSHYRIDHITWETAPQHYSGTEDGAYIAYDPDLHSGLPAERGQYADGKRIGVWELFAEEGRYYATGTLVGDFRQGKWFEQSEGLAEEGIYIDNLREGRWVVSGHADNEELIGFDIYKNGKKTGTSERREGDQIILKGQYENDKKQGFWYEGGDEGNYEKDIKIGPWKTITAKGNIQEVEFSEGKKHGLLRERNRAGTLVLEENYNLNELHGRKAVYNESGTLIGSLNFINGKYDGQQLGYSPDGTVLRGDIYWSNGRKHGSYKTYYSNGLPETIATYHEDVAIGNFKLYGDDGYLVYDHNRCRWDAGGYYKTDRCGRVRTYSGKGKTGSDVEYLFGRVQSGTWYFDNHPDQKGKETIIEEDGTVTKNTYYENGQLKCTEHFEGYETFFIEGKQYKDINGAQRESEKCFHESGIIKSRSLFRKGFGWCIMEYDNTGKSKHPGPEECPPKKTDD